MSESKKALRAEVRAQAKARAKARAAGVRGRTKQNGGSDPRGEALALRVERLAEGRGASDGTGITGPDGLAAALRVERLAEFAAARTVALYAALPDEVPTAAMLARWAGTKRLVLPVIIGVGDENGGEKGAPHADEDEGTDSGGRGSADAATGGGGGGGVMVFREYRGPDDLSAGAFGIASPAHGAEIPPEQIDLMLVPGVAFDSAGGRLGRGGGFYDRYLSAPAAAHIHKVGLCPSHVLLPRVPTEPHDVTMDAVIVSE